MKKIAIILILLTPGIAVSGITNDEKLTSLTEKVMKFVNEQKYEGAIDILRPHWPLPKHEIDSMAYKIRQQMLLVAERFGKTKGYILGCEQVISNIGKRYSYLQKFENHAVVWVFIFYKPDDEWIVNTFSFHDRWHDLFGSKCSNK